MYWAATSDVAVDARRLRYAHMAGGLDVPNTRTDFDVLNEVCAGCDGKTV